MTSFLDCWISVATALIPQALAGEPELAESLPRPMPAGVFGFSATLIGEEEGRFSVVLDAAVLDAPLMGDGLDQKVAWGELLREVAEAAAGELLVRVGKKCRVENFEEIDGENQISRAFQLKSTTGSWAILVRDEVCTAKREAETRGQASAERDPAPSQPTQAAPSTAAGSPAGSSRGVELLLDVELEAALRFGCRELPLSEILELGPGDVVELDRHIADPVDLIVGDKIVARGEVVLVNGNFGLRVTEVAAPRKRLESIRCLF